MLEEISIPFKIDDVFKGLAETTGILRYENGSILIEFQTKDSFIGFIQTGIKFIKISVESIAHIELKKKFFYTQIIIKPLSLLSLKELKGYNKPELILFIEKKYREEAQQFISYINLLKAESILNRIDG
ncbi:MAG: hypothetical protein GX121_10650 [Ignavibacteria bacterium]|nr:hypothetical protein [Ignavibacteria bacterium]